jgi:hypothetical protein
MPVVEASAWVPVDPATAFAVSQTTGATRLRWDPFIAEQHLVDGAQRPGKGVRTSTRHRLGFAMLSEYVSYAPPRNVGMKMVEGPWFFASFAGGWRFEAAADPATGAPGTLAVWRYSFTSGRPGSAPSPTASGAGSSTVTSTAASPASRVAAPTPRSWTPLPAPEGRPVGSAHVASSPDPLLPDYGDAWNGGIVPGVLGGSPPGWFPRELADAESVVLLVLDGVGCHALEDHLERVPAMGAMAGRAITTVAPSTTSCGLTSIVTGLTPAEHGIVGYRMRVGGEVLNILQWRTSSGERGPDPSTVQPHAGFLGMSVPIVTRSDFGGSGFTGAHLRTGTLTGWSTTATLVERCRRHVADGERFVYAYYDGVDKVAHEFGLHDGYFAAELAACDRLVDDLLSALPSSCALVVTADHGHVHVGAEGMRDLKAVEGHVAAWAGEGRFRSMFARPGSARRLREVAQEAYGHEAWVLSRDEVWDAGWLGPSPSPTVQGRLGDVVIAAHAPVAYIAPDQPWEALLVGCHGSLTPDEMRVPFLVARGTAT